MPFDRSRMEDRRFEGLPPEDGVAGVTPGTPSRLRRRANDYPDVRTLPPLCDGARDFSIAGELVASVNNIYSTQTPGSWKELELYQTAMGRYVCLEIWRTLLHGKCDQYWLTTCEDLQAAREFFGNNSLAGELFDEMSAAFIETTD